MADKPSIALNVLPNSGKVDQLKREFASATSATSAPPRQVVDAAPAISAKTGEQKAIEDQIIAAIRTIFDPEIPLNIYDLGLIYAIDIGADNAVKITMTLTAPGCPVAASLVAEVQRKVQEVDAVKSAAVDLVWEPAWSKDRLSEAALLELGIL